LHQHAPLVEVFSYLCDKPEIIAKYLRYKEHVCRQMFADDNKVTTWNAGRRRAVEEKWPEYSETTELLERPNYMLRSENSGSSGKSVIERGRDWLRSYLSDHVQRLQELKQHHVHIWDEEKQEYIVLEHCRRKDKKNECKSFFPRTQWLISSAVVLCTGLLQKMGMPSSGRKNLTGAMHGPMNEANINGTHPAMLVTQACNSDVQLPYRLPINVASHSSECPLGDACLLQCNVASMVNAAQIAQDAQVGYTCDYQNKRQPCGCNEVKECCNGFTRMGQNIGHEPVSYQGKRYMTRILCHAYNSGIVRSAVENRNLRSYARAHDVTFAESFRTCRTVVFPGATYLQMVQKSSEHQIVSFQRDLRNTSRMRLTQRNHALLYGHRPMAHRELKYLSPYEFTMYWEPQLLKYPTTLEENASGLCHATLTPVGECKVQLPGSAELVPVIDYVKMSILFLLYISDRKILCLLEQFQYNIFFYASDA